MEERALSFSEFANEEGFELNQYLTHLFDYVSQLGNSPTILSPLSEE